MSRPTLVLIDGHALIYRAYHAFVALSTPDGTLVNAVYGFCRILLTVLKDFHPEYIAVSFDHPKATFRHTDFAGYKQHRPEMPDDLKPQIAIIKEVVTAFNMPQFEVEGYEADDVIGTLARQAEELNHSGAPDGVEVLIVTGDRDTFQLVTHHVHVWMPGRGKGQIDTEYDADGVEKKMGVKPSQIVDLKALMGDASDNIPGVTGIGEKTAAKLIVAFESVEHLYRVVTGGAEATPEQQAILTDKIKQKLIDGYELAMLSRKLATIDRHVPITLDLPACQVAAYDKEKVLELFEKLDFKSLRSMLPPDEFEMSVQQALF